MFVVIGLLVWGIGYLVWNNIFAFLIFIHLISPSPQPEDLIDPPSVEVPADEDVEVEEDFFCTG